MSKTPWVERKSMLEITADRGRAGLDPIDMGYLYIFKNGETRHFSDDSEAYSYYAKYKEKLNQEPTI